ncbi:hypothetical protein CLOM_g20819 [Closterium sp. NIES-68]|nr:hypothetical protein CLOM_g20819 [Closterium sp. NIES-68]
MGMADAGSLREQAKELIDRRDKLEAQIDAIAARLNAPGGGGIRESLVDKEGFPRADIDIPKVRTDRHRLATLHADHKQLTGQIESLLLQIHAQAKPKEQTRASTEAVTARTSHEPSASTPPTTNATESAATSLTSAAAAAVPVPDTAVAANNFSISPCTAATTPSSTPFAVVDEVTPGSPAEADGVKLGDRLVSFGSVAAAQMVEGREGGSGSRVPSGADLLKHVAAELRGVKGGG